MNSKTCNLCKIREADKMKSHIIPKFMCKRLFENTKPRHTIQLSKEGKQKKLQDTPKENNILCSHCEKRLAILERYFSGIFIDINALQNTTRKYTETTSYNQQILICEDLNPTLFKLFIFSLIWRCSISKLLHFETFNLKESIEEELRVYLDENLKSDHSDLLSLPISIENTPRFHFCLIKPKNKSRGAFTAYEFAEDCYSIYTVDYAIFFYTQNIPYIEEHILFSNKDDEKIKIVIGEDKDWKKLNQLVIQRMLNYNNHPY